MDEETERCTVLERATDLRRTIHRYPELAGREVETARRISEFFSKLQPDLTLEQLGGHGLAFVFGDSQGPTVLLRCELDALPIEEPNQMSYRSTRHGISHKCGHDGHMAILAAVGTCLSDERPKNGRVVLLYQPAEENGAGAAAILQDPRFTGLAPDFVFALHNLPGFPLGRIVVRPGAFTCASRGMTIQLRGRTAHAAQPDTGICPALAACQLIQGFSSLGSDPGQPEETAFATVIGATIGEKAFGTAPGNAEVWATLRSETDVTMARLIRCAEQQAREVAEVHRLDCDIEYEDVFAATVNSASAVDVVLKAAGDLSVVVPHTPFPWSEDFGRFSATANGAFFGIGAGDIPDLHDRYYDFPDELIPIAVALFQRIIRHCSTRPASVI